MAVSERNLDRYLTTDRCQYSQHELVHEDPLCRLYARATSGNLERDSPLEEFHPHSDQRTDGHSERSETKRSIRIV
jgi:hypothetical protein